MNEIDHIKKLSTKDLNLITIFHTLLKYRHVTRAANALNISQSAMSHSLGRLRKALNDELFVKVPKGVVPTPRALELQGSVAEMTKHASEIFLEQRIFSPRDIQRTFRIQTTDLIEMLLMPTILKLQTEEAPGIKISFSNVGFALPKDELESGEADLAIAGFFGQIPDGFFRQKLFQDKFKCCVSNTNLKIKSKMNRKTYLSRNHILIAPGGELSGGVDKKLAALKLKREVVVGTSGFLAAGWAAASGDAILTGPASLIESFEKILPVKALDCPIDMPKINIVQVWHRRLHKDPSHKWLREKIYAYFRDNLN